MVIAMREDSDIDGIQKILREDPQKLINTMAKLRLQAVEAFSRTPVDGKPSDDRRLKAGPEQP